MSAPTISLADEIIFAAHRLAAQGVGLKAAEALIEGSVNGVVSADAFGEWSKRLGQHVAGAYAGGDLSRDLVESLLTLAIETMNHRLGAARMTIDTGIPEGRTGH